jgi:hypothetical protein
MVVVVSSCNKNRSYDGALGLLLARQTGTVAVTRRVCAVVVDGVDGGGAGKRCCAWHLFFPACQPCIPPSELKCGLADAPTESLLRQVAITREPVWRPTDSPPARQHARRHESVTTSHPWHHDGGAKQS